MTFLKEERDVLYKRGKESGIEKGIEKTEALKNHAFVENLIIKLDFSNEQIADLVDVSVDFVEKVRKELAAKS